MLHDPALPRPAKHPRLTPDAEDNTIHVDATGKVVELLLDFALKPRTSPSIKYGDLKAVLVLCDKFGFEVAEDRALQRLQECLTEAPWDIFVLACQKDLIPLAKEALKNMGYDPVARKYAYNDIPMAKLAELPVGCTYALAQALAADLHLRNRYEVIVANPPKSKQAPSPDWHVVGNRFRPVD